MSRAVDLPLSAPLRQPTRTCVGCRRRADKSELLRVTASGGLVLPDPRARAKGRGAYVHPRLECIEQAIKRRALGRALRASAGLDPGPLAAWAAGKQQCSEQPRSVME